MLINSPNISGSLKVTGNTVITGSLTVLGGINATITGSATTASYVEYSNVANKPTLVSGSSQVSFNGITDKPTLVSGSSQVTYSGLSGIPAGIVSGSSQVSFNGIVDKPTLVSGSAQISFNGITDKPTLVSGSSQITYSGLSGIPSGIVSSSAQVGGYGIFATTGSNTFIGNQTITGSVFGTGSLTIDGCITATGQIVAQTINVQQVTSSIVYSCGSNIFGTSVSNTQQFTGSMLITGSNITANVGTACFSGNVCAPAMDIMPSGIGSSTLGGIMRIVTTGTSTGIAVGQSNTNRYTHIAANDIQVFNDDFFLSTRCAFPLSIGTCYTARLTFAATGIACFSCQVCAPVAIFSGCVGINTTAPDSLLHVLNCSNTPYNDANTLASGQWFRVSNPSSCTGATTGMLFVAQGPSGGNGLATINAVTTSCGSMAITFATRNVSGNVTERMRITAAGNVGIGTCNPVGKLDVTLLNTRRFIVTYDDSIITIKGANDTGGGENLRIIGDNLIFNTNSVGSGIERLRINGTGIACFACQVCAPAAIFTGCVGIGQTSPAFGLEVFSSSQTAVTSNNTFGANFNIIFNRDNTGDTRNCFNLLADQNSAYIRTLNDFPINFVTNSQNRLLLSSTGIACFACTVCALSLITSNVVRSGDSALLRGSSVTQVGNNITFDAFRFLNPTGGVGGSSSSLNGMLYMSFTDTFTGGNQVSYQYLVITTGNGVTPGPYCFAQLYCGPVRGTNPISSISLVNDGAGGAVKVQATTAASGVSGAIAYISYVGTAV